ncbi:MAG TPA: histidine kinase [Opitutus sp.]|nr:histidine kinase [Opitutus sp.]
MSRVSVLFAAAVFGATVARGQDVDWPALATQPGQPFVRVFGAEDYAGSPINSHVLVQPDGLVYVANSLKILEFDGARWRQIPQPFLSHTSALVRDRDGRIWTSVAGVLSRLAPDSRGLLHFEAHPLGLTADEAKLGQLIGGVAADDGLYLCAPTRLVALRRGSVATWKPATRFESIFWMDGALHVTQADAGLFRLRGNKLERVGVTGWSLPRIFAVRALAAGSNRWLWLTSQGPLIWNEARGTLTPLADEAAAWFAKRPALHGVFLSDGRLAFGTPRDGLLVFDAAGRLGLKMARREGLPSDRVNEIAEDAEGGLWLAQQGGLARVQLDSPYRFVRNLEGSMRDVARDRGRLYVAHGEGVSVWDAATNSFQPLAGLPDDTPGGTTFFRDEARLLVNASGVREITPENRLELVAAQPLYALHRASGAPDAFLGLQRDVNGRALWILVRDGKKLRPVGKVPGVVEPERFGFDGGDGFFWGTDASDGVWRADFRGGLRVDAPVAHFPLEPVEALPGDRYVTLAFPFGGGVEAARAGRLFRFAAAAHGFVPETRIEGLPVGIGFDAPEPAERGAYWFRYGGPGDSGHEQPERGGAARVRLFHVEPDGRDHWRAREFFDGPIGQLPINKLQAEPATHTLWICSTLGLFSADTAWQPRRAEPPLRVMIRRLETAAGRLVFGGDEAAGAKPLRLAPDERAVRIEFAAPVHAEDFRGRMQTRYRTRCEGLDDDWTPWTLQNFRELTNLPHRGLVFHVQARDFEDRESPEAVLSFTVAAPWWLTGWACAGEAVLAGGLLAGAMNLRTRGLRRKNRRLENLVAARTEVLSRQNQELTRLHRLELDEKITARLAEEKARLDVLRYQLNPHFLFNALASIRGRIPTDLTAAREMVDRLADFCRFTLHGRGGGELGTLDEELAMLRAFLDIEQARLGELLRVEFDVDPALKGGLLPRRLLLPLVENAIKYGQATSPEFLEVRITARPAADGWEIVVGNSGEWVARPEAHGLPSLGLGLDNLRERLNRHYPGTHRFTSETAGGWVRVRLRLPLTSPTGDGAGDPT